jgi:hypothetical protein
MRLAEAHPILSVHPHTCLAMLCDTRKTHVSDVMLCMRGVYGCRCPMAALPPAGLLFQPLPWFSLASPSPMIPSAWPPQPPRAAAWSAARSPRLHASSCPPLFPSHTPRAPAPPSQHPRTRRTTDPPTISHSGTASPVETPCLRTARCVRQARVARQAHTRLCQSTRKACLRPALVLQRRHGLLRARHLRVAQTACPPPPRPPAPLVTTP